MWSVVTLSPSTASTRAPVMSLMPVGSAAMPSKYGGRRTESERSSQANASPVGTWRDFHRSSPANTSAYDDEKPPLSTAEAMTSWTSLGDGQISARKTSLPSVSCPIGSSSRLTSMVPASAYATTSGGDAR